MDVGFQRYYFPSVDKTKQRKKTQGILLSVHRIEPYDSRQDVGGTVRRSLRESPDDAKGCGTVSKLRM
jgi:hypothetical protein